jgi:hypothetical protein
MVFPSYEELLDVIGEMVTGIELETLIPVFEHWMERPGRVVITRKDEMMVSVLTEPESKSGCGC